MWLLPPRFAGPFTVIRASIGMPFVDPALLRMPIVIFPNLNLPVVYVAQPYGGMSPGEMEGYLVSTIRVSLPLYHGLSRSSQVHPNVGLVKLKFHPERHEPAWRKPSVT